MVEVEVEAEAEAEVEVFRMAVAVVCPGDMDLIMITHLSRLKVTIPIGCQPV